MPDLITTLLQINKSATFGFEPQKKIARFAIYNFFKNLDSDSASGNSYLKIAKWKINAYQQFVKRQHVGVGDTATTKVVTTVLVLVSDEVGAHLEALSPGTLASLEGASVPLDATASGIIPLVDVVQPKRRVSGVPL